MLDSRSTLESILTLLQTHGGQLHPCTASVLVHLEQLQMEKSMSLVSHFKNAKSAVEG